jgi:hypothetical protein
MTGSVEIHCKTEKTASFEFKKAVFGKGSIFSWFGLNSKLNF